MRRVAISAGHSNVQGQDRGAIGNGLIEGVETVKIRNQVKQYLECAGAKVSVDPDWSATGATVKLFRQYFYGKDIVIDIHLNAATSPTATGSEVIVPSDCTDFEHRLATELTAEISSRLGIRNRGVKREWETPRKKLLWFTIPAETVLIECFFLSNPYDVGKYQQYFNYMSEGIANIILKYRSL